MKLLLAVAVFCVSTNAFANDNPKDLQKVWATLNDLCRGGPGDDAQTLRFCDQRTLFEKKLNKVGYCYGESNQFQYQMEWHHCH